MQNEIERRKQTIGKHADLALKEIGIVLNRLSKAYLMATGGEESYIIAQSIQDLREVRTRINVISNHNRYI